MSSQQAALKYGQFFSEQGCLLVDTDQHKKTRNRPSLPNRFFILKKTRGKKHHTNLHVSEFTCQADHSEFVAAGEGLFYKEGTFVALVAMEKIRGKTTWNVKKAYKYWDKLPNYQLVNAEFIPSTVDFFPFKCSDSRCWFPRFWVHPGETRRPGVLKGLRKTEVSTRCPPQKRLRRSAFWNFGILIDLHHVINYYH